MSLHICMSIFHHHECVTKIRGSDEWSHRTQSRSDLAWRSTNAAIMLAKCNNKATKTTVTISNISWKSSVCQGGKEGYIPVNPTHLNDARLMLGRRFRRRPNINPALFKQFVSTGIAGSSGTANLNKAWPQAVRGWLCAVKKNIFHLWSIVITRDMDQERRYRVYLVLGWRVQIKPPPPSPCSVSKNPAIFGPKYALESTIFSLKI